jgi:hypothetical protein
MQGNSFLAYLQLKSASILGKWSQLIRETYPTDTARFLKDERDRFVNPVGYVISHEVKKIYEGLVQMIDPEQLAGSLSEIIRIRAVQDFSPSQAVGVVFLLKQAAREELAGEIAGDRLYTELLDFEARVDRMALLAFDIYMKCREKVSEIKINEVSAQRDMALVILARAGGTDGMGDAE